MCKKLVVVLMMLAIASYAYALQTGYHPDTDAVVISSFESGMDGWVVQGAGNTATAGVYSTGATDGFYSLKLSTPNSWWNEAMFIDLGAMEGGSDVVFGNDTLSIDFAWLGSDNTGPGQGWNQNPLIRLLVNTDLSWGSGNWWQSPEQGIDTGYYDYEGGTGYIGTDGSATLSFNYQNITSGYMNSASTQYKFILEIVHVIGDVSALYLDNVRFSGDGYFEMSPDNIPEPTTIALLGLGGLALLRRKR